jgi:hypothetical protein
MRKYPALNWRMWAYVGIVISSCVGIIDCGGDSKTTDTDNDGKGPGAVNRSALAGQICNFRVNMPQQVVSIQRIDGSVVGGNVDSSALSNLPTVWSALYATRWNWILREDDHPYRWIDASGVYGVGRASSEPDAKRLARKNCENLVDNFRNINDAFSDNTDHEMECVEVVTQRCY